VVENAKQIKVKAFAVLPSADGTHHLVLRGADPTKEPSEFHRLLGGHMELGESSRECVVREIREETGTALEEPRLLGVLESRFVYKDEPGHEIVFVYAGRLADPGVVGPEGGWLSDNSTPMWVEWRPIDDGEVALPLYPHGVDDLLAGILEE
jgi:ADP-ribose pyrophosphatase YjhB (NUDIX family)